MWSPVFECVVGDGGERGYRVGHELIDEFLEFVAARSRPNTVKAYAHDLKAGRLEVFCTCDPEVAVARAAARIGDARHPIHRDVINPRMLEPLADVVAAIVPLGLDDGLIEVETTDGVELGTVLDDVRWLARSKPM